MPALQGEVTQKLYATPGEILKEAVAKANRKVYEVARQQRINMGTTVTAALLEGPRAYVVNVGDSRTYRLRNGALEKVTRDHSLVANLVQAGVITEEEVYTHPNRNQIFRSLGEKPEVEVDLFPIDLKKGDQLILCSDGLWEMVRDPQIRDILLRTPDPQTACDALVRAAYDAGGEDNITVIIARVN
jgi:serine/threonine protein phosphatase PrpC